MATRSNHTGQLERCLMPGESRPSGPSGPSAAAAIKVSLRKPVQMPLQQEGPTSRRKRFLAEKAVAQVLTMLRPRLLLRRLRLMPRQIRKSPGALKVVTAQPRVDVPTEKRGYHSMRRRGYQRLQRRIAGAIFNGKTIVSGPAASPISVSEFASEFA